jgi:hypothetical protein
MSPCRETSGCKSSNNWRVQASAACSGLLQDDSLLAARSTGSLPNESIRLGVLVVYNFPRFNDKGHCCPGATPAVGSSPTPPALIPAGAPRHLGPRARPPRRRREPVQLTGSSQIMMPGGVAAAGNGRRPAPAATRPGRCQEDRSALDRVPAAAAALSLGRLGLVPPWPAVAGVPGHESASATWPASESESRRRPGPPAGF